MKITNPITLDVARSNSYICLLAKQFDSNSRYLEITLADNGQPLTIPADASAVLRATRADGTGAVVSGTVANGKATVEIDDYILEVNGAVTLSLEISKDGEILTTPSCNLTIQKADASGWIRVYIADSSKAAGNYYITIGGVSYSFTTSQAIPAGGSVYFSSNNATAETRNATGAVIETGLVLTEGTTGTQLVTDVPTMSFLATIAGRLAALESEMPNKADKDGIIALANNLTPYSADSGATQSVPFIAQGTGCGNGESIVDTGSYSQVKKKLGNTAGVNQLAYDNLSSGGWVDFGVSHEVADGEIKVTSSTDNIQIKARRTDAGLVVGHYYVIGAYYKSDGVAEIGFGLYKGNGGVDDPTYQSEWEINTSYQFKWIIAKCNAASDFLGIRLRNGTPQGNFGYFKKVKYSDLTLWFGSNDRIPAHLLSHPEDFGCYYSGSLAYNPGQLVNADGSGLTSIGRNVWDEEWELGSLNTNTGANYASTTQIRSKNYIEISPNTAYYNYGYTLATFFYDGQKNFISYNSSQATGNFTTPSNAHFMRFFRTATTYNHDITISLYYPGESGYNQYYPYSVLAEVDTGNEVLRSAGSVADEKTPDGTITRRVGVVDLGTLKWTKYSVAEGTMFRTSISDIEQTVDSLNIKCSKYATSTSSGRADKTVSKSGSTRVDIIDNSYSDAATFETAMSGVYLYYELATPATEQGTPFSGASADNFTIDDFGSMYWTQSAGVPQGVEIFYPYDYKAAVDTILNEVNGDVTKLVTSKKVPGAPSSNGTYVLKVTVSDGTPTYSWVAE